MILWLKQIASPPAFEDEEIQRIAQTLYLLLFIILVGLSVVLLNNLLVGEFSTVYALVVVNLILIGTLWLTRRGYVQWSAMILVLVLLSAVTYTNQLNAGIHDIGVVSYPAIIVIASLLLNRRNFVLTIVLTIAALGWLAFGEWGGLFTPLLYEHNLLPADFLTAVVILGVTAVISRLMASSLERSLAQARKEIAERRQAEKALRESEATTRALFEAVPDAVFQLDREGTFLSFKPADGFETIVPPGEFIGKKQDLVLPPELACQTKDTLERTLQSGRIQSFEYTMMREDREEQYEARLAPCGEDLVLVLVRDISELKEAQSALEERLRFESLLFELSASFINLPSSDVDQAIEQALERIVGFLEASEGIVGRLLADRDALRITHAFTIPSVQPLRELSTRPLNWYRSTIRAGEAIALERIPDDLPQEALAEREFARGRGIRSHLALPLMAEGRVLGVVAFNVFDATREWPQELVQRLKLVSEVLGNALIRKQVEEEIQKLNEELERRVAERTAQLEAANQELEAFAYSVSHDLRAPLRAMDGFSRILIEDYAPQIPPEAQHYLDRVRANAQHMGQLIDDLLTFSRLGRQELCKEIVSPREIIDQVLQELTAEQKGRQVEIVVGNLPACEADPALLKQLLVNLLSNAFKFTRKREGARVEIGFIQGEEGETYYVRDNGVGFNMRYVDKLFGVFQRLHSAEEYEGTGVGLAIVQRIVRRHGGRVWAEAEVNKGATFYFTLEETRS